MGLLLLFLFVALGVSFLCSLLESVILSITSSHIALLEKDGHKVGKLLKNLKENIDRSLSSILTLNTIAHTVGAAGVGAQAQKLYGDEVISIVSGVLTFLMLFVSEIIPKTVGVTYWKKLAPFSAYVIKSLIILTYPLVVFFEMISKKISGKKSFHNRITREEMIVIAELGLTEGALVEKETRVIRNLLRLQNMYVSDVMTPKEDVFSFHKSQTVGEVMEKYSTELYSRVPVYDQNQEDIIGIVLRFNIFNAHSRDEFNLTMGELMTPIYRVQGNQILAKVLDDFIHRHEHMFLVVDENNNMLGIITLEDAIETLLGVEIEDEIDSVEEMRKKAVEQWKERVKHRIAKKKSSLVSHQ